MNRLMSWKKRNKVQIEERINGIVILDLDIM